MDAKRSQVQDLNRTVRTLCSSENRLPRAVEVSRQAFALAEQTGDADLKMECEVYSAAISVMGGKYHRALKMLTMGLEYFEKKGAQPTEALADLHCLLGLTHEELSNLDQSRHHHMMSMSVSRKCEYARGEQRALTNLGVIHLMLGEGLRGCSLLLKAIHHPLAAPELASLAYENLIIVHLVQEQHERAEELLSDALALPVVESHQRYTIRLLILVLRLSVSRKDPEGMESAVAQLAKRQIDGGEVRFKYLLAMGAYYLATRSLSNSRGCYETIFAEGPSTIWARFARLGLAELLLELGDIKAAAEQLQLADIETLPFIQKRRALQLEVNLLELQQRWPEVVRKLKRLEAMVLLDQSDLGVLFELQERVLESELIQAYNKELSDLNERLQEVMSERAELLGVVVHDLRGALSLTSLAASMLERDQDTASASGITSATDAGYMRNVLTGLGRMAEIVSQIDTMMQLDSGSDLGLFSEMSITRLVEDAVDRFQPAAKRKELNLELQLPGQPIIATTQPHSLLTITENLISNAIKYSPPGRRVTVALSSASATGLIKLEVRDQGLGWEEPEYANLFRKFTRLSARPTGSEPSTGLGLYIVKNHAARIGATISGFSPGSGKGATFILDLPPVYHPDSAAAAVGELSDDIPR